MSPDTEPKWLLPPPPKLLALMLIILISAARMSPFSHEIYCVDVSALTIEQLPVVHAQQVLSEVERNKTWKHTEISSQSLLITFTVSTNMRAWRCIIIINNFYYSTICEVFSTNLFRIFAKIKLNRYAVSKSLGNNNNVTTCTHTCTCTWSCMKF